MASGARSLSGGNGTGIYTGSLTSRGTNAAIVPIRNMSEEEFSYPYTHKQWLRELSQLWFSTQYRLTIFSLENQVSIQNFLHLPMTVAVWKKPSIMEETYFLTTQPWKTVDIPPDGGSYILELNPSIEVRFEYVSSDMSMYSSSNSASGRGNNRWPVTSNRGLWNSNTVQLPAGSGSIWLRKSSENQEVIDPFIDTSVPVDPNTVVINPENDIYKVRCIFIKGGKQLHPPVVTSGGQQVEIAYPNFYYMSTVCQDRVNDTLVAPMPPIKVPHGSTLGIFLGEDRRSVDLRALKTEHYVKRDTRV